MNITFMLNYFTPEQPTINFLFMPLIDGLLAKGHHVNIITPNPTRGIKSEDQKKYSKLKVEKIGNLTIYRVKCYTYKPEKFSKFRLLRRYLSISVRLAHKLKKVRSDLVFVTTNPPLLYAYLVSRYTRRKRIPLLYNVQDIYPNNIMKEEHPLYGFFDYFQKQTLKNATEVITISETMELTLLEKADISRKLKVIHNFDISRVKGHPKENFMYFDPQKFNVVYAGNIGYVQDIDIILSAAKLLIYNPEIVFHIFGEGSQDKRIAQRIKDEYIVNTTYYPPLDVSECANIYQNSDINLISVLPGIINTALPLKTASVLASDRPIIFIGLDDNHKEAWAEQEGIHSITKRNYKELATVISRMYSDNYKNRSFYYKMSEFDENKNVEQYLQTIEKYLKLTKTNY